jgi:hypothetical protein
MSDDPQPGPHASNPTPFMDRSRPILAFLLGGIVIYGALALAYVFWITLSRKPIETTGDFILVAVAVTILIAAIYVGGRIVISGVSVQRDVIPAQDRHLLEPLITASDEKAIEQYVRLSSLAGATGTATRLGLTGLPLLTVALTLIFSGLHIYKPDAQFLDLAKLTLGAFIGSFVQRSATAQAVTSTGRLPLT